MTLRLLGIATLWIVMVSCGVLAEAPPLHDAVLSIRVTDESVTEPRVPRIGSLILISERRSRQVSAVLTEGPLRPMASGADFAPKLFIVRLIGLSPVEASLKPGERRRMGLIVRASKATQGALIFNAGRGSEFEVRSWKVPEKSGRLKPGTIDESPAAIAIE